MQDATARLRLGYEALPSRREMWQTAEVQGLPTLRAAEQRVRGLDRRQGASYQALT